MGFVKDQFNKEMKKFRRANQDKELIIHIEAVWEGSEVQAGTEDAEEDNSVKPN